MLKIGTICLEQGEVINLQRPYAVLLINSGSGSLCVKNELADLRPGRIFLIRECREIALLGEFLTGQLLEFQKVLMDFFLLQHISHQNRGLYGTACALPFADLREGALQFVRSLITQLADELDNGSHVSIFQQYLFLFLWHVNRQVPEQMLHIPESELLLSKFISLMEQYYKTKKGAEFYASEMGISRDRLYKLLRDTRGLTCHQMVIERRMMTADLLLIGDSPIKEIAYVLGFAHHGHLDRYYLRYKGVTPAEFRKRLR